LEILSRYGVSAGDAVTIETQQDETIKGVIMPRYESASENYIVVKLKSGYNVGIEISRIKSIVKVDTAAPAAAAAGKSAVPSAASPSAAAGGSLPRVALISTGGTIASKIDYRTGGVRAALSASELYASVPELASFASVDPEVLMSEYSENLTPAHWTAIAEKVAEKVGTGNNYAGVVISHGTDTMHYTAAALSFALQNLPVPVVLVGAQRSSDRPSSDAALNLIGATTFAARAEVAGVFVAMHDTTSDDAVAVHVGTRVRKNHTSRRDAFESIDTVPVALVKNGTIEMQQDSGIKLLPRGARQPTVRARFDGRVSLLKYYPGFDPALIDHVAAAAGSKAIILEGTGLGHVNKNCFPALERAIKERGVAVFMTSQCIWGRVRMTVYDTGRDLLEIGVVPLSDMISETAVAKAMWALANLPAADLKKVMQENVANEVSEAIPI
jgi:glutamyl-tRNA(Gln) amidotransferase subunit D